MTTASRLAFALVFSAISITASAAPDPAVERTTAFIAAFKQVPAAGGDAAVRDRAYKTLDAFFDFEALTTAPLAPRADKFDAAQKADFATRFRELIRRVSYPDSGAFFRKAKLTIGAARTVESLIIVPVQASVPADDLNIVLDLHWKRSGDTLRLVDIAFDGDSLVKDYQVQFARIVDRDGAAGLMRKLGEREAALGVKAP